MRSTVAALCLLFVTGFLRHESEPTWREAVARAALAGGVTQHAVAVEQARGDERDERAAFAVTRAAADGAPARALTVGRGGLPAPRAPDHAA